MTTGRLLWNTTWLGTLLGTLLGAILGSLYGAMVGFNDTITVAIRPSIASDLAVWLLPLAGAAFGAGVGAWIGIAAGFGWGLAIGLFTRAYLTIASSTSGKLYRLCVWFLSALCGIAAAVSNVEPQSIHGGFLEGELDRAVFVLFLQRFRAWAEF